MGLLCKWSYTDNSPELTKAVRDFGAAHGVAVPHRPQTNGVAERAVRAVVEGARTLLDQAGMDRRFWPYASVGITALRTTSLSGTATVLGMPDMAKDSSKGLSIHLDVMWSSCPQKQTRP